MSIAGVEPPSFSVTETPDVLQTESTQAERIKKAFEKVPFLDGTFDATEEIASLKKLTGTERKQKLWQIKTKLARQKEARAQCRIAIEQEIEINPQIGKDDLYGILHEFAIPYGFTEPQIRTAEAFIDVFDAKRNQIIDLRDQFPDDTELVKRLTGVAVPIQIVSVAVSPYAFIIRTDDATYGKIWSQRSSLFIPPKQRIAFTGESSDSEKIPFVVITEDANDSDTKDVYDTCLEHEPQHVKEKIIESILFRFDFDEYLQISSELLSQLENAPNQSEKQQCLREFLQFHRNYALLQFRSELFALKSEKKKIRDSYNFFTGQDKGPYDYLFFLRKWVRKDEYIQWQDICNRIISEEYANIILRAIEAFESLQKAGYSAQEVIALLVDVPVKRWQVVARRMIEAKPYDDDVFLKAEAVRFFEPTRQVFCKELS